MFCISSQSTSLCAS